MPILVIERGDDKGKKLTVEPGNTYVFGRDPKACAIALTDTQCSRRHFQIDTHGPDIVLRDLESTNGTFLNDEQIGTATMKIGDKVQVGDTIMSLLSDEGQETPAGLVKKTLGGYEIQERVGRGGMGTVYRATQLSLNREVALKVLSARLLKDESFIEKFKSEARSAGQLNHPNIVQVYDVGTDRKVHFFSMEFMDGGSLQDKIGKDAKLPWEEALDVLTQAARALIFAEKRGIVHRDVKPDNFMMTQDGQVKLADLGLARRTGQDQAVEEGIFGTPHFISPEQAKGKDVDHRADLYSLGATAYRLLSGRTPFNGKNVQEIVHAQIHDEPEPLAKLSPDVPPEVVDLVARLMKKNPDERPASATDLLEELDAIRLKYHLKASGVGTGGKGVYIAVVVALLAVVAVAAFALFKKPPPVVPNGGGGTTIIVAGTAEPEVINVTDPEIIAENAFYKVDKAERPLGLLKDTWSTRKPEWLALADRYDEVAGEHPETKIVAQAERRAKEIRDYIQTREGEAAAAKAAAEAAWNSLKSKIDTAYDERRFALAENLLSEGVKDPQVIAAIKILTDAAQQIENWQAQGPGSIRGAFLRQWSEIKRRAAELRDAGKHLEALTLMKEYLDVAAEGGSEDPYGKAVGEAEAFVKSMKEALAARLAEAIERDRLAYYRVYRNARHHADAPGVFDGNAIFEFRFADAAAAFEALLGDPTAEGSLATEPYRELAAGKATQLKSIAALMEALIRHLNEKDVSSTALNLPPVLGGGAGVTLEINWDKDPTASMDGLEIAKKIRVGSGVAQSAEMISWDRFSAAELWSAVFLDGERWEMSSEEHAAAARFLAETGVEAGLEAEIAAAGTALTDEERSVLTAELDAIRAWTSVLASREERPPEDWHILAAQFVEKHGGTSFFVFVYGFSGPGDKPLLSRQLLNDWVESRLKPLEWK